MGTCNLVIRFSDLQNNREFVQSKGRARAMGSFYVILHNDKPKTDKQLKQFKDTEQFLSDRFQKNEKSIKEHLEVRSVSGDNHQVNCENDKNSSSSLVYHNAPAGFLQRNIRMMDNQNYVRNYVLSPEFEPPESEPCLAILDLTDVTILNENGQRRRLFQTEVRGEERKTREDAFISGRFCVRTTETE